MKFKKNLTAFAAAALAAATALTGCTGGAAPSQTAPQNSGDSAQLNIVTTIFPEYDWVRQILGEDAQAQVTLLAKDGVDMHSYQPSAADMRTIADCDLLIYVGGTSDAWVEEALANQANPDRQVLNLMEVLGDRVKTEELVEGMEPESHDHSHDHEEEEHDDHDHDEHEAVEHDHDHEEVAEEADEHIWLSLKNAQILCKAIQEALAQLDPDHAADYQQNLDRYNAQLAQLDEAYQQAVDGAACKTLLFGDRFPFRYLVDDYGLEYYAAFAGCSAETEASFATVAFLAQKVDELQLPCVLTIDGAQHKIAQTVVDSTTQKNQQVLSLNSMQSVGSKQIEQGASYLSIMEENLQVLKQALA